MKPAKPDNLVDLHLMLRDSERELLRGWAREECRSLNGQILRILRNALAGRQESDVQQLTDAERIRDATRRAATGS